MQHETVCRITCAGRSLQERGRRRGGEERGKRGVWLWGIAVPVASLLPQGRLCAFPVRLRCVSSGGYVCVLKLKGPAGTSTSVVPRPRAMCCAWQARPFCARPRVALGGRGGRGSEEEGEGGEATRWVFGLERFRGWLMWVHEALLCGVWIALTCTPFLERTEISGKRVNVLV